MGRKVKELATLQFELESKERELYLREKELKLKEDQFRSLLEKNAVGRGGQKSSSGQISRINETDELKWQLTEEGNELRKLKQALDIRSEELDQRERELQDREYNIERAERSGLKEGGRGIDRESEGGILFAARSGVSADNLEALKKRLKDSQNRLMQIYQQQITNPSRDEISLNDVRRYDIDMDSEFWKFFDQYPVSYDDLTRRADLLKNFELRLIIERARLDEFKGSKDSQHDKIPFSSEINETIDHRSDGIMGLIGKKQGGDEMRSFDPKEYYSKKITCKHYNILLLFFNRVLSEDKWKEMSIREREELAIQKAILDQKVQELDNLKLALQRESELLEQEKEWIHQEKNNYLSTLNESKFDRKFKNF